MNVDPELYDRTNQLQRRDAEVLLEHLRQEQEKGSLPNPLGLVIDAGCGTGNITRDFSNYLRFKELVAFDLSHDMINYANAFNGTRNIVYKQADLSADWDQLNQKLQQDSTADLVVSIHCIHWIVESLHNRTMANIRNMMKPDGICYILLFSWSDLLPIQEQMTLHPKWRRYFQRNEQNELTSQSLEVQNDPSQRRRRRSSAPFAVFDAPPQDERIRIWKQRCHDLCFVDVEISLKKVTFKFQGWPVFQEMLKSICHFLPYIPGHEQPSFLADYYSHVKNVYVAKQQQQAASSSSQESDFGIKSIALDYEYIVVKARKPLQPAN